MDQYRTIDGTNNNPAHPSWGSAGIQLLRVVDSSYEDGISSPSQASGPNCRTLSNILCQQNGAIVNWKRATDFLWQWGQFLDHDIDLTESNTSEPFFITVPSGDPWFDPLDTGTLQMPFFRSMSDIFTGTDPSNPRQQLNGITAFIDASNVYGSDPQRAAALRTNDGTGRLKVSDGDFLPYNIDGLPNAPGNGPEFFLAGDVRANEQVALTAMHTLFVREHNRLADQIRAQNGYLSGEEIYDWARAFVGAEMQVITYREFLPVLLGPHALRHYRGYKRSVNPGIANVFSTAAYRLGHSMLNESLLRLNAAGEPDSWGHLRLADAFFAPERLVGEGGLEPIFRGLAAQPAQAVDAYITDAVRNFLFGPPGSGGLDLASLNLQRGRDHGLPDYNTARIALGLHPKESFSAISSDPEVQQNLQQAYGSVAEIDVWIGGLCEDPVRRGLVGELFFGVLKDQFERLRDGDRFWYQRVFRGRLLRQLERTTLAQIIRRNTAIGEELPNRVFRDR